MSSLALDPTDEEIDAAEYRALLYKQSVFLPWQTASGCGLRPENLLRFVAAVDRYDNKKGDLAWESNLINTRCGYTSNNTPAGELLTALHTAGLITTVTPPKPGGTYTIHITRTPARRSLRLPLGAIWTHRWHRRAPVGPRYGKDTAQVLAWLLAILRAGEWADDKLSVDCVKSAREIAEDVGMSYSAYRRAWAVVRKVCVNDPWIEWQQAEREDNGLDAYWVHVDWRKVPLLAPAQTVNKRVTPQPSGQGDPHLPDKGGTYLPGRGDPHLAGNLYKETNPVVPILSSIPSPQSNATITSSDIERDFATKAGAKKKEDQTPDAACATWQTALVAAVSSPGNARRLPMTKHHAQALREPLSAAYNQGWDSETLAACLTLRSPDVDSVVKTLRWRLNHLGPVNVIPSAKTAAQAQAEAIEEAAFEAAASSRSADKYVQRTM